MFVSLFGDPRTLTKRILLKVEALWIALIPCSHRNSINITPKFEIVRMTFVDGSPRSLPCTASDIIVPIAQAACPLSSFHFCDTLKIKWWASSRFEWVLSLITIIEFQFTPHTESVRCMTACFAMSVRSMRMWYAYASCQVHTEKMFCYRRQRWLTHRVSHLTICLRFDPTFEHIPVNGITR